MRQIKGKLLAAIVLPVVVVGFLAGVYWQKDRNNPLNEEIAIKFVRNHLMMPSGGVRIKFKDEPFVYDHPGGGDVLSESQGLLMRYAAANRDEDLFAKLLSFVENTLDANGIISYRYSDSYGVFPTNAALDDFRIIHALLEASETFGEPKYQRQARIYADRLYGTNVEGGRLYDFYDPRYRRHNSFLTLCYADFRTMLLLGGGDEPWKRVSEHVQPIVEKGYISDAFPLFATSYDYGSGVYNAEHIQTVQSLLTAIHLAEVKKCPQRTVEFVKEKVKQEELFGAYGRSGEAIDDIQSTAVYALASILGKAVGDRELQSAAFAKMRRLQITEKSDPLYGAFADAATQDAYSFDNLYALLAFMDFRQK